MIARTRPNAEGDNVQGGPPGRSSVYRDRYVQILGNGVAGAAEEGSYFTANNATTATELTGHAEAAIGTEATKPLLYLYNGGSKYIIIDQVYIRVETVHANDSDTYYTVSTTNELSRDSGGTQLTVNSSRSDSPHTSGAVVYFGAVVTTPSASKLIGRHLLRQATDVTEDRYHFQFGAPIESSPAYVTTYSDIYRTFPPVCIAPGGEFLFTNILPGGDTAGTTHEVSLGFWER